MPPGTESKVGSSAIPLCTAKCTEQGGSGAETLSAGVLQCLSSEDNEQSFTVYSLGSFNATLHRGVSQDTTRSAIDSVLMS